MKRSTVVADLCRKSLGHHAGAAGDEGRFPPPLRSRRSHREAWRSLAEEPFGRAIERYLQNDFVRGLVLTDAKIGVFTHPHDPTLLQNRCFLYHLIGNKTGEWKVPVGGMGAVARELEEVARQNGAEMVTGVQLRTLDVNGKNQTVGFELDGRDASSRDALPPRKLRSQHPREGSGPTPTSPTHG